MTACCDRQPSVNTHRRRFHTFKWVSNGAGSNKSRCHTSDCTHSIAVCHRWPRQRSQCQNCKYSSHCFPIPKEHQNTRCGPKCSCDVRPRPSLTGPTEGETTNLPYANPLNAAHQTLSFSPLPIAITTTSRGRHTSMIPLLFTSLTSEC
jgi:hypothetical protein